jgi:PhnB protein
MPIKVDPIPKKYRAATPYLYCRNAAAAIEFYKKAFGARETERFPMPNGKVGHAEIMVGEAPIMLADEFPEMNSRSPQAIGGSPVCILVYVENVDAIAQQAIAAGAKVLRPLANQFYGDRSISLEDPFGHLWNIATHIEDVPPDELKRRAMAMGKE